MKHITKLFSNTISFSKICSSWKAWCGFNDHVALSFLVVLEPSYPVLKHTHTHTVLWSTETTTAPNWDSTSVLSSILALNDCQAGQCSACGQIRQGWETLSLPLPCYPASAGPPFILVYRACLCLHPYPEKTLNSLRRLAWILPFPWSELSGEHLVHGKGSVNIFWENS